MMEYMKQLYVIILVGADIFKVAGGGCLNGSTNFTIYF